MKSSHTRICFLASALVLLLHGCGGDRYSNDSSAPNTASPPTPSPGVSTYDVAARVAALPFAVTLPVAPNWSADVTVNSTVALNAALTSGAKRITCVPGTTFTSPVTIGQPDTYLVMDGCTINDGVGGLILTLAANRIKVQGGTWSGGWTANGRTDLHLYDVTMHGLANGAQNGPIHSSRILVEHSTLLMDGPVAHVLWSNDSTDLVIANSILRQLVAQRAATVRTPGCQRVVVMDSWLQNPSNHNLRAAVSTDTGSPVGAQDLFWGRNLVDGGAMGDNHDTGNISGLWVVDNEIRYGNCCSSFAIDNDYGVADAINNRTATGNTVQLYAGNFTFEGGTPGSGVWINSGNTYLPSAAWAPVSSTYWNGTGTYQ